MTGLTSQQQTEFAAMRQALNEGDYEMVASLFDILLSLEVPILPLLDALSEGIWYADEDDDKGFAELLADILQTMEEGAIPALATFLMSEEGSDLMLDLIAERLGDYDETTVVAALKKGLRDPDERIQEGSRDFLAEMSDDSDEAEDLLEDLDWDD